MSRNVVIVSPASNQPIRFNDFTGTTWGQLKQHPSVVDHVGGNVEAVLRQGNVTLSREDAQLPEGDFTIFLVPTKNKAGNSYAELGQTIAAAIEKAAAISHQNDIDDLKEKLIENIAVFFEVDESDITDKVQVSSSLNDEDRQLLEEYNNFR